MREIRITRQKESFIRLLHSGKIFVLHYDFGHGPKVTLRTKSRRGAPRLIEVCIPTTIYEAVRPYLVLEEGQESWLELKPLEQLPQWAQLAYLEGTLENT